MPEKATPEDIMADIQRVADELGRPPSYDEYSEHGTWSGVTAAKRFDGGFTAARAAALDIPDGRRPEIPRDEVLADIERVAEIVGSEPSKADYHEYGEYALSGLTYRFDSWVAAKKEAGVYEGLDEGPTRDELLADMRRVDAEIEPPLSQKRYNEHGEWSTRPVKRRFESWERACQEAGVTRPNRGPQPVPDEALLKDIQRVAGELEKVPSKPEYNERGSYSQQFAQRRYGSWATAVRRAGFEPYQAGGNPGERNGNWRGGYEPYYGPTWHEQRRRARERDGYECRACGMSEEEHKDRFGWGLEVHHIRPVREFDDLEAANRLENLVSLCRTHHREYEALPNERAKELIR